MDGAGRLLRLQVRTGWIGLAAWPVAIAALVAATAAGIAGLFQTAADRAMYAATVGDSVATQALNGRAYAADTLGGITAYEVGFMGQVLFPIAGLAIALRHTRREEEAGRLELLTAARLDQRAPSAVAFVLVLCAAAATGLLVWAAGLAVGLPMAGTAWYAASIAATISLFGALGLLVGQLVEHTRSGWMLGLGLIAAAYLLRVLVDGLQWSTTWLSPLGWYVEVRPYAADPQWWPLAACGVATVALVVAAGVVRARRDLGAGVVRPRPGPARAAARLATPSGLAWRLTRGAAYGWSALAIVVAGVFGTLAEEMTRLVEANPSLIAALGIERGGDLVLRMGLVVAVIAAAAAAVQGINRLGEEETSDRLGLLAATRVPRARVWSGWLLVDGASAPDLLYEIGSAGGPPKLDEELQGTRPGAILKFNDTLPERFGDFLAKSVHDVKLRPSEVILRRGADAFKQIRAGFVVKQGGRQSLGTSAQPRAHCFEHGRIDRCTEIIRRGR
jgi:ABC-2 type transport system permease protein